MINIEHNEKPFSNFKTDPFKAYLDLIENLGPFF